MIKCKRPGLTISKNCIWAVSLWPQLYLCWTDEYTYTLIQECNVVELLLLPHSYTIALIPGLNDFFYFFF